MSEHKSSKPAIIVPDTGDAPKQPGKVIAAGISPEHHQPKATPRALQARTIFIAIVIIAVAVALYIPWEKNHAKVMEIKAYQSMIKHQATLQSQNQNDAAKKLLTDFLAKYPHNEHKDQVARIDLELAAIFANMGDHKTAQQWQTKALANKSNVTFAEYYNLATTCQQSGDKACAIDNFKKALDRLHNGSDKPLAGPEFERDINQQLKDLGA